jgi:hypothetical protein
VLISHSIINPDTEGSCEYKGGRHAVILSLGAGQAIIIKIRMLRNLTRISDLDTFFGTSWAVRNGNEAATWNNRVLCKSASLNAVVRVL